MPRVHTLTARKDYPEQGITKGDTYYKWSTRITAGKSYISRTHRSKTYPKPSQLTSSAFLGALGDLQQEGFKDITTADDLRAVAEQIRELGQEEQEKFDNMPEGFQQGDTGQTLEERAQNCEAWADAIDEAAEQLEEKLTEIEEAEQSFDASAIAWSDYESAMDEYDEESGDPEPEEPDCEDLRGRDFEQERDDAISEAISEAESACPF